MNWIKKIFSKKEVPGVNIDILEDDIEAGWVYNDNGSATLSWVDKDGVPHLKVKIPTSGISKEDAEKYLTTLLDPYKKDIKFDDESGEIKPNVND